MEKIKLYDDLDQDQDELMSSWIWDIRWENNVLIIRRYEDIEKNNKVVRRITPMKYNNIPYKLFEKIKRSDSKGSIINRHIIQNKEIEPAQVSESTKEYYI